MSSSAREQIARTLGRREASLLLVLLLLVVVFTLLTSRFATAGSMTQVLVNTGIVVMVAAGEALVLFTRNIDVSVGSMIGVTAVFASSTATDYSFLPVPILVLAACFVGGLLGSVNGLLVARLRVPSIMVTLGTLYVFRGLDSVLTGSNQITSAFLPPGYADIPLWNIAGVPGIFVYAAIIVAVLHVFVSRTYPGRSMLALGSNPLAAEKLGIASRKLVYAAFAITGVLCGLAGVMWGGLYGTVDSSVATGFEIVVLAAVVIGGVSTLGGVGSMIGVLIGSTILAVISVGLALLNVSQFWVQVLQGAVILGAIVVELLLRRREARPLPGVAGMAAMAK